MTRIYGLLLFVMAMWGVNLAALAILVREIDPIIMTGFRIFVAGIAVLFSAKLLGIFRLPTKIEWKTIGIITIFNVVIHHSLLAVGLTKTAGVNAGVILGASPLVTMALSVILLRHHISGIRIVGFLLGFIGIFITSLAGGEGFASFSYGDLFVFLCMVAQAISFILISKLNPTFDPRLLTGYMLLTGSLAIFVLGLLQGQEIAQLSKLFSPKLGTIFLFSAVIATAFGHMTYNYAIKNVGPAETTVFVNLNTLFAILAAALFLGEPILRNHYLGLGFIVVGVFLGSGTVEYLLKRRQSRA